MLFITAPFRALMRRNLIYRKRNFIAAIMEIAVPIVFAGILVSIKNLAQNSSAFQAQTVEPVIRSNSDAMRILSFSDYVTAIVAKRQCVKDTSIMGLRPDKQFYITGIPRDGSNWQVPFVKCDSRRCVEDGEDAYKYCDYPILALAPTDESDTGGLNRARDLKNFIEGRYPELNNSSLTHFGGYDFVQIFQSNAAIEDYVKNNDYGKTGREKIGLAVILAGGDPTDYKYAIRVNSTNFNAPQEAARPASISTPDTRQTFSTYARKDNACAPQGGAPNQGPMGDSCTGQYIYNGLLTTQRLVHDWIMDTVDGANVSVSEYGVNFVPFPSGEYTKKGFYGILASYMPVFMMLAMLYPIAAMVSYVVQEKQLRQKELLKTMSVKDWEIGWSWFLNFYGMHFITATGVALVTGQLFENSDTGLLFVFWQLCFLGFVVLSLLVSALFSTTIRAVLVGLLVTFVGFILPQFVDAETGSSGLISFLSLHPITAMSYGLIEIGRLEDAGVGVTPSSISTTDAPSGYTFSNTYGNLIASSIILGILTWYLNRVIRPGYGQAYPFYFPFMRSYWCPGSIKVKDVSASEDGFEDGTIPFEPVSDLLKQQSGKTNIEIKHLRKAFKENVAVDDLNLNIYSGQITALLGHNGAGKTTTINMLTGALAPTGGTAYIAGKDIRTELSSVRGDLGICLQHDCLFPKLTVREHLQFFSRLKGLYGKKSYDDAEADIDQTIRDVALEEKSNTYSKNLSGGMKRKLSLAIAFCGGSKIVFLDEPTSGMDPFSRRFCWNVIRHYRQDRCIILTTHFMDEADILGDRIAIMSEGRLRCCGSSLFLKKTYGVGYQLTIEKRSKFQRSGELEVDTEKATPEEVLKDIVLNAVKEASLLNNVGTELSFQLPLNAASGNSDFVPMLEQLDVETKKGGISAYGVSLTTLDEVFLLVARGEQKDKQEFKSAHFSSKNAGNIEEDGEKSVHSKMDLGNERLFGTHVQALLKKRAASFKRDKRAWCCTTILPSLFVLVGLLVTKFTGNNKDLVALPLSMEGYNVGIKNNRNPIPYNAPGSPFTCNPGRCTFDGIVNNVAETGENYTFCGGKTFDNTRACSIEDSEAVMSRIVQDGAEPIAAEVDNITQSSEFIFIHSNETKASWYGGLFFNHEPQSAVSGSNETYTSFIKQRCIDSVGDYMNRSECQRYGDGIGYTVAYNFTSLHAAPLFQTLADQAIIRRSLNDMKFKISSIIHPLPITAKEESYGKSQDAFTLWFFIVLSFPFIAGAFATFVVAERESKSKHLQIVAGTDATAYWLSTLIWDIINYCIPLVITVILIFAFSLTVFTTTDKNVVSGVLVLFILFGPAAAGFAYCVSFGFKSPAWCNITIIVSGFIIGLAAPIAALIMRLIGMDPFNPSHKLVTIAKAIEWIGRFFPTFCLGKGLLYVINIDTFQLLLGKQLNAWDTDVLLIEVIFLACESLLYPILAIYLDILSSNPEAMRLFQNIFGCRKASGHSVVANIPDDDDVVAEQQRVLSGQTNDDAIVISNLTKIYSNGKVAVNKLSLGVPPGECFGLLGINGAGKTTTMAMLTAEFPPTDGDATLAGFSVRHEPQKTRRRIGYCPQFDAHFENLTGREHVALYACIKGIPKDSIDDAVASKLREVGLSDKDSDRLSSNYSGGMKRRLSLACATIGQPQLVFLDECSTGVDPVARREIWQMVSDLVAAEGPEGSQKTSVILTTHSMDECEALCPRIGIMANGKLRCLGSAQHLKSKFGQGYQLELKVATVKQADDDVRAYLVALARIRGGLSDEEAVSPEPEIFFNFEEAKAALNKITGDDYLSSMLTSSNPTGYGVYNDATSAVGVDLAELASFVASELRMRQLQSFVSQNYSDSVLRERQDMKARFEVSSNGVSIAQIFASIEKNKDALRLSDYGVSQTSLEQVFNKHAAEAEELKHGRMDG